MQDLKTGILGCFLGALIGGRFGRRPAYFAFARDDWKKRGINRRMRLEFLKLPGYWIRYGVNPF